MEKLVSFSGLDERGTNCQPHVFTLSSFTSDDTFEAIALRQQAREDQRAAEQQMRSQVHFTPGQHQRATYGAPTRASGGPRVPR